jgi:hypothetical protein
MAAEYKVNINIGAGVSFNQMYYLTGNDLDPLNITGAKFNANLAKHARSMDVTQSTSEEKVYNYHPFDYFIDNGPQGQFSISMNAEDTAKLEEGKYVYSITMEDINGYTYEVVSGLAFVDVAFGLPFPTTG